jgi:methylisocitrate lyase
MNVRIRFRELLAASEILLLPGAADGLSARIITQCGFKAFTAGGYGATATLLGAPDVSLLAMTEMADHYARIVDASPLPVLVDGDTGFGNSTNVARTVRAFERAGVAALFIEDQTFPKRCGHTSGKSIISAVEMVEKLFSAVDARVDQELVIMARTDALAIDGIDAAIERGQLYREAGADMIFVEALTNEEEMRRVCAEINAPCLVSHSHGSGVTPALPTSRFEELGFAALALPGVSTFATALALQRVMRAIAAGASNEEVAEMMMSFEDFYDLIGFQEVRAREAHHQERAVELHASFGGRT